MAMVASGNRIPIKLLSNSPSPSVTARTKAQRRGCGSSSSRMRRNAHTAKATVKVSMTSGINTRVNKNRPTQVAMHKPAYNPARLPKAQAPKAIVNHERAMAEIAIGIRATQSSCHPVARGKHVTRDLRLYRVHVIHKRRRRDDAAEENDGREENDHKFVAPVQATAEGLTNLLPAGSGSDSV